MWSLSWFSVACGDPLVLGSEHHPTIAEGYFQRISATISRSTNGLLWLKEYLSESYHGIPQNGYVRYPNDLSKTPIVPIVLVFHVRSQGSCHSVSYIPRIHRSHRQPGRPGPAPFNVGQPKNSDDFGSLNWKTRGDGPGDLSFFGGASGWLVRSTPFFLLVKIQVHWF